MSNQDPNLDRVRQILQRMERSIDDARDRRLREGHPDGHASHTDSMSQPIGSQNSPMSTNASQGHGSGTAGQKGNAPIRFDDDGRPIVGRAKPKNGTSTPQGGTPYSPGSGSWR